ncbi:MAG: ornithine carbamoyltransferase [Archangiaceae bacterium]|nr:ornithine carbamoyltransferase [Archangiaceae bacterium]
MAKRDFLKLSDLTVEELSALFHRTKVLKEARTERRVIQTLLGRTLVMIFEKSSTRTRLSFEAAMAQLGGHAINLPITESQLGRGESLADTARVVSGYADAIMFRTFADERIAELAKHATVPVINGLTDGGHPVQLLADLFTMLEHFPKLEGLKVAFVGDGASNMGESWVEASQLFKFDLRIAAPEGYRPKAKAKILEPKAAVEGCDVVTTDVWTSMGQEKEKEARLKAFAGYIVDPALMSRAAPHAIVLHCLPAHRGEEIAHEVLEGPQSVVWAEAENRMHVQKALLERLILDATPALPKRVG